MPRERSVRIGHLAATAALTGAGVLGTSAAGAATLAPHGVVEGVEMPTADVRADGGHWESKIWDRLARDVVAPGRYELRLRTDSLAASAIEIPPCAGRQSVRLDGRNLAAPPGPLVVDLAAGHHEFIIDVGVSDYERRIACGEPPRVGHVAQSTEGLSVLTFATAHASEGGGKAVVFIPRNHDVRRRGRLLVGTHPWNGSMWTYASYAELLKEAQARDIVLLLPSGLGNSLYTGDAEDEVLRAVDALSGAVAIDPEAVSIWGASMGGAGALTIAFHHPDRFAAVTSFFGDTHYDRSTYVRFILRDETAAHRVNALDVVDNARHLGVWLVHGELDRTCPVGQSERLAGALGQRGFRVRFDRVPGAGHSGALVARFLPEVVAAAATARVPIDAARVTYRSVRASDVGAYGVTIDRAVGADADAYVDVERQVDGVHVRRADGVRAIHLSRGSLGTDPARPPAIVIDGGNAPIDVGWEPGP
ncbi:MAG: prolyl oligopeptidase family serine peptidase [Polyangiaceae bacterium]